MSEAQASFKEITEISRIICMGNCAPDVMKGEADTLPTNWPKLEQHSFCEKLSQAIVRSDRNNSLVSVTGSKSERPIC